METINQERLEAFWKRRGFTQVEDYCGLKYWRNPDNRKHGYQSPTLTLDNLFKYAVPAAATEIAFNYSDSRALKVRATVILPLTASHAEADTPALALFIALEKLKEVEG
jgi:hypothetical protein